MCTRYVLDDNFIIIQMSCNIGAVTSAFQFFPPDFPTSVNSLRDGARLRGSKGYSKYQAFKTCRKS